VVLDTGLFENKIITYFRARYQHLVDIVILGEFGVDLNR
jgi:hypothetical protein